MEYPLSVSYTIPLGSRRGNVRKIVRRPTRAATESTSPSTSRSISILIFIGIRHITVCNLIARLVRNGGTRSRTNHNFGITGIHTELIALLGDVKTTRTMRRTSNGIRVLVLITAGIGDIVTARNTRTAANNPSTQNTKNMLSSGNDETEQENASHCSKAILKRSIEKSMEKVDKVCVVKGHDAPKKRG